MRGINYLLKWIVLYVKTSATVGDLMFLNNVRFIYLESKKKKHNPFSGLERTWGFKEIEAPIFQDNRHLKVISLSALRTARFYPSEKRLRNLFC